MFENLRHKALEWWSSFICRRAGWVLFVAAVGMAASVSITYFQLTFQSDRNALISSNLDWNRRFEDWRTSFPGNDDFYIVVDSGPVDAADRADQIAEARSLVDELGPALLADEHVAFAVWGFDESRFSPKTIRMLPQDKFKVQLEQIAESEPVLISPTPQRLLARVMASLRQGSAQIETSGDADEDKIAQAIGGLTRLIAVMGNVLAGGAEADAGFEALNTTEQGNGSQRVYLTSDNDRLFFIRVTPHKTAGSINALSNAITAIRSQIAHVSPRYPGVEAGLTGIDVVETDETDVATRDSTITSIIASILITLMLIVAFHSWRVPLLAMIALLTGIAWSFGFLTLTVGYLQVLSVVFAVILLGLGIAYGIHLASGIERVRSKHPDTPEGFVAAMRQSIATVGPGVITGAVTTAAAFCMTMFTDFRGVAEMGFIAAGGIVLCLLAMFSVYPALLRFFAYSRDHFTAVETQRFRLFDERWVVPFANRPKTTLVIAVVVTAASLLAVSQMRFDYDLLKLQPRGVDSVLWQQRITDDGGQSIWSGVSITPTLEEARRRKTVLLAMDCVSEVNGIGLLFPADEAEKIEQIESLRARLSDVLSMALEDSLDPALGSDEAQPGLVMQLSAMQLAMQAARGVDMPTTIRASLDELQREIQRVLNVHAGLNTQQQIERIETLNDSYSRWRRGLAGQIAAALDVSPLTPADVPGELLRPYIATPGTPGIPEPHKGGFALEIQPRLPADGSVDGPLDPVFLPRFIRELKRVDPNVTGVIVQIYHSGHLILSSYRMAGLYALVVVFVLVWLDFRSIRAATLSLTPVAVGFAATFGVMWVFGVSVNPANIIVLPLMFGIGVDSGVHMLHRYRQNPDTQPLGLTQGTGKGITITSYTTMIGFGSMMFASHRGIASLGFVMMTGIGLTMLACWTVVPAWLSWRASVASEKMPTTPLRTPRP